MEAVARAAFLILLSVREAVAMLSIEMAFHTTAERKCSALT